MANRPALSEAEMEVLKALWEGGPSAIRSLNGLLEGRGRRWAYTTVSTLLQRLAAKGFVAADSTEVPHVYRATVSREEFLRRSLRAAADDLYEGDAAPLVLALVKGHRFTTEDLARFRRLIDEAAADAAVPPPTSSQKKPK